MVLFLEGIRRPKIIRIISSAQYYSSKQTKQNSDFFSTLYKSDFEDHTSGVSKSPITKCPTVHMTACVVAGVDIVM